MYKILSIRVSDEQDSRCVESCAVNLEEGIIGSGKKDKDRAIAIVDEAFIVNKATNPRGFCSSRFKENVVIGDMDVSKLDTSSILLIGSAKFQVSSVGKKCHVGCPELLENPNCKICKHVAFARVLKEGIIKKGDEVIIIT